MDIKNENDEAEFDFSGADWMDEGAPEAKGSKADTNAEDPFGASAFDDDPFGGPSPSPSESDPFAADGDDPFADGASEGFDFQDMPSPETMGQRAGDPDAEFGDLAGESFGADPFAAADGFGGGDPFADEGGPDAGFSEDGFAADEAGEEFGGSDDPFSDDGSDEPFDAPAADPFDGPESDPFADPDQPPAPSARQSSTKRGIPLKPILLAAAAVAAAWVGWGIVQPIVFPGQAPVPPQQQAQLPDDPPFPVDLPPPAQQPSVETPPIPSLPLDPSPVDVAEAPLLPVPAPDAALPPEEDPLIGLSGGPDRGGIEAIRAAREPDAPSGVAEEEFARFREEIESLIDRLGDRIASVEATVRELESRPADAAPALERTAADHPPVPSAADLSSAVPPLKPEIVDGVTLKGVSRGLAWISTPSGVVEVKEGDSVPGAGTVVSIREYRGSWIVATSSGLVVQ